MRSRLGELVRVADIITPNLTEACMLLKIPYFNEGLSRAQAKSLLVRLSELGPNYVVITGAPMASGSIANIGYDRQNNSFWYIDCDYVPVSYPGTGDLFASVLTGGFLTGDSLPMAMGRQPTLWSAASRPPSATPPTPATGSCWKRNWAC